MIPAGPTLFPSFFQFVEPATTCQSLHNVFQVVPNRVWQTTLPCVCCFSSISLGRWLQIDVRIYLTMIQWPPWNWSSSSWDPCRRKYNICKWACWNAASKMKVKNMERTPKIRKVQNIQKYTVYWPSRNLEVEKFRPGGYFHWTGDVDFLWFSEEALLRLRQILQSRDFVKNSVARWDVSKGHKRPDIFWHPGLPWRCENSGFFWTPQNTPKVSVANSTCVGISGGSVKLYGQPRPLSV